MMKVPPQYPLEPEETIFVPHIPIEATSLKKKLLGFFFALLITANTVGQSEYTEYYYKGNSFSSYFFLSWFCYIWLILSFPLYLLLEYLFMFTTKGMSLLDYRDHVSHKLRENPNFSYISYFNVSTYLSLLNFLGLYLYYVPLSLLPVAILTAIYQTVIIFVFILSVIMLKEEVYLLKIVSVLLCLIGVVIITLNQLDDTSSISWIHALIGVAITIIQAFSDALFEVTFRKKLGDTNHYAILLMNSFFGIIGISFGILVPVFGFLGWEPMIVPNTNTAGFLLISASFAVMYFLTYAFGLSVASPLYLNISSLLAIPLSAIIDYVWVSIPMTPLGIVGLVVVFCGVLVINAYSCMLKKDY